VRLSGCGERITRVSDTLRSPTVRRRRLAAGLRQLREAVGLTHDQVADDLGWHRSKLGRIEGAQFVRLSLTDLRALLDLYQVTDTGQREALIDLARQARERGWWHSYSDLLGDPHATYIGLEADAAAIKTYQSQLVPALLQTPDYTRAVAQATRMTTLDAAEADRFLAARTARQEVLAQQPPVQLWAVLDEAVLRRQVGGPAVMHAQLQRLIEAASLPPVTLQVLPDQAGEHAGLEGSFTILGFPQPTDHDVVYLDAASGGVYVEKPADIALYATAFDHIRAAALSPKDSLPLMMRIADAMRTGDQ
jgi:transcriptional regulator with XRE-family HTH domain